MRLEVPFFRQTTPLNCGAAVLKMVLAFFGKEAEEKEIESKAGLGEGKAIYSIQLAVVASSYGFKVEFFTRHRFLNTENQKLEFYQNYSEMDVEKAKNWLKKAETAGVTVHEKTIELDKLLSLATENSVPIVLLDWNVIKEKKGYQGHFAPITGYDEKNVFIHNSSMADGQEYMMIPKDVFEKARKSNGTDEDLIIIYKPRP